MIIESIFDLLIAPLELFFGLLKPFTVALPSISGLAGPIQLFNGLVGLNIFSIFLASFTFWFTLKSTFGLAVYIYKLLPFT